MLEPDSSGNAFVYTVDVITPIVDDPEVFGEIAACNSISDVYAMGGTPQVALSFVGMPDVLGLDALEGVMRGLANCARSANMAIVGGHTIKDSEPKAGLAVIGTVAKDQVWTQKAAQPGQALILSKPLGTGVLAQASKKGAVNDEHWRVAVDAMRTLNRKAAAVGRSFQVSAATDVTGFGMLGHLSHIAKASGLRAEIEPAKIPLFDGAREAVVAGHVPGGTKRNLAYVRPHLRNDSSFDEETLLLLADAQTSGGLLMVVPKENVSDVLAQLPNAACIGSFTSDEPGTILLKA